MSHKIHLQRISERNENTAKFLNTIFPLVGAELAAINQEFSSGLPAWHGNGNLNFIIGIKDGQNPVDVLAEFSEKAKQSKLKCDLLSMKLVVNNVRAGDAHTNSKLRNDVWAAEIQCSFYVHYNMEDCVTAGREKSQQ